MGAPQDFTLDLLAQQAFLRRLALDLVGRPEEAEDLVQEANLCALERPPEDGGRLRSWLATVVARVAARSRWRAAMRCERERNAARPEAVESPPDEVESARSLFDALAVLPEPYRQVLVLRYWHDQSPSRIARTMALPLETVRSRLARGRRQLREELERRSSASRRHWGAGLVWLAWSDRGWLSIVCEPLTCSLRRWRIELAAVAVAAVFVGGAPRVANVPWVRIGPAVQLHPLLRLERSQPAGHSVDPADPQQQDANTPDDLRIARARTPAR